jgi:hypothetical protein
MLVLLCVFKDKMVGELTVNQIQPRNLLALLVLVGAHLRISIEVHERSVSGLAFILSTL